MDIREQLLDAIQIAQTSEMTSEETYSYMGRFRRMSIDELKQASQMMKIPLL